MCKKFYPLTGHSSAIMHCSLPLSPSTVKCIVGATFGNKLLVKHRLILSVPPSVQRPFRKPAEVIFDGPVLTTLLPALACLLAQIAFTSFSRCKHPLSVAELSLELDAEDGLDSQELSNSDNSTFNIRKTYATVKKDSCSLHATYV